MAEEIIADSGNPQVQLVVDEREMRTAFANGYRIYTTGEEVVVDFGFNMLNPNPQTGQQQISALEARLNQLHSYETPEIVALPFSAGFQGYLDWMEESTG